MCACDLDGMSARDEGLIVNGLAPGRFIKMAVFERIDGDGKELAIVASGVVGPSEARSLGLEIHAEPWRRIVMLKFFAACAFLGTIAMGTTAMAEGGQQKQLSWDQLIQACQNPTAFQSQRQPNAIRLTCEDTQFVWETDHSQNMEIDNRRSIVASLSSDKFFVVKQENSVPMNAFQTPCPHLKEVQVTYTKSFALTCQELINHRGSMNDFCKSRVDQDMVANKSLATRTDTGNVYNMCAAPELIKGYKGQGGNKAPAGNKGQLQPPSGEKQPGEKQPQPGDKK